MTPRSFFSIVIKIIGFYLAISAFISIPQIITSVYSYKFAISGANAEELLQIGFLVLFSLSSYLLVLYYCLYKTDWIIDKLRLDNGFAEEEFGINIHRSTMLRIAVIVIGGVMVADSLPLLCKSLLTYFQNTRSQPRFIENIASGWLVFYFIKFVIGFSFVSASRLVVNFIELKRKRPAQIAEESE